MFNNAPFKQIVTIDWETYWDRAEYSVTKMTTEEYIRDPRFSAHGACLHEFGTDKITQWYRYDEIGRVLKTYDWSKTAMLAHNAQFDAAIAAWHYDVHPVFIFDSLSMARALRGIEVGNSLAKLAESYRLPPKGDAVHDTNGVLTQDLTPSGWHELAEYCKHDVWLCEQIFSKLLAQVDPDTGLSRGMFPIKELRLIDMTIKMYTRAQLQLDQKMLQDAIEDERTVREGLLARLNIDEVALASNQKFAEVLESLGVKAPTKVSKTTGKPALALAKTDAMFQAMLHGDNEEVRLLCEARLKVKSTTERTRAQRFLDISRRGPLPVPLSYYGALSGRWTASKGSAINMQNLKRRSFLRKAIMAPDGHQLGVGDLSQIEPRVLAWLSDYEDMLRIFKAGGDPYAAFGAQMFNIPGMTKDSHPDLRQSAKSALLGCFGPDTLVLTNAGWKPIVRVQATDTVWDGEAWVQHHGVVPQGEKNVLTAHGISATSDHEILTERGWVEWSEVLASPCLLARATSLANLPVFGGSAAQKAPSGRASLHTSPTCVVPADGKGLSKEPTCAPAARRGATHAPSEKRPRHAWRALGSPQFARSANTAIGFLTASARSLSAAPTPRAMCIRTTVGAVSQYILRGLQTAWNSCATLLGSMVGTSLRYSLIASTTRGATFPATFALSHAASTPPTSAASKPEKSKRSSSASPLLRQRIQTYDIAYAGPRNRYTVLTDAGPLLVHNCGYGLGWASFAGQLLTGFLGAPPVRYDKTFAKKLGVTLEAVEKFMANDDYMQRMAEIPHTCTDGELLIHCVAAKRIIDIYRATAWPVVAFWELCDSLMRRCLVGGEEVQYKCLIFRKEEIELPNGMRLRYPNLRIEEIVDPETGRKEANYVYGEGKDTTKLYAGKITNNVTQALARIVMTDGMLRVSKRFFIAGTVHDELIAVVPDADAPTAKAWILEQMTKEPSYMPGIPLAADGGLHRRYGMAKD